MTEPVAVSLIWFGTGWQEPGKKAVRNAITSLTPSSYNSKHSEVPNLGDWRGVVRQYRESSNAQVSDKVDVGAECFFTGPELNMTLDHVVQISQTVFNKTAIENFSRNLKCNCVFEVHENQIYQILVSHTVKFIYGQKQRQLMDLCSSKFQLHVVAGMIVNKAWVREPQNHDDHFSISFSSSYYVGSPNGDEKIDTLAGNMLVQIAEEVTYRDGRGWISNDGNGLTISSSCFPPFLNAKDGPPLYANEERNISFNAVGLNGNRYIVLHIWNQKIKNCALAPAEICGSDAVVLKHPRGVLKGGRNCCESY